MKRLISIILSFIILFTLFIPTVSALTAYDARMSLRMAVDLEEIDLKYDINKDGKITASDSRTILRLCVGLDDDSEQIYTQEFPFIGKGVCVPSGVDVYTLQNALQHNLKDYAEYFIEAEQTYGINAIFIAAIAAHESGWGTSYVAKTKNNLFGWKGSNEYRYFNNIREGIMHVSRGLKVNYLSPDGCYFNGYTVEDVAIYYCNRTWANYINSMMRYIENRC